MILKTIVVGPLQCNCIILGCEDTREAVIVDPGDEAERILKYITQHKLRIQRIIHTHAHVDHLGGTYAIQKATHSEILFHQDDLPLFEHLESQALMFELEIEPPSKVDKFIGEGDAISCGMYTLRVIHTPGHSPGSVCFYLFSEDEKRHILFSGDTLFFGGIGRTDLWGGSFEQLMASVKDKLFILPDETIVYPGHGQITTIGEEKQYNPFLS